MNHKLYLTDPGLKKRGSSFFYNKTNTPVIDTSLLLIIVPLNNTFGIFTFGIHFFKKGI